MTEKQDKNKAGIFEDSFINITNEGLSNIITKGLVEEEFRPAAMRANLELKRRNESWKVLAEALGAPGFDTLGIMFRDSTYLVNIGLVTSDNPTVCVLNTNLQQALDAAAVGVEALLGSKKEKEVH